MPELINPRIDLCFKKLFGSPENTAILIDFINSVVSEADQVSEITLLNPYNARDFMGDKLSILDIKAKDTQGKLFNIEIQISNQEDYDKPALYYWAKLYTEQMKTGRAYRTLKKTIGIHVLNFLSVPEKDNYHSVFTIRDLQTNQQQFKDFELHTLELVKFDQQTPDDIQAIIQKMHHKLDLWVAFLTKYQILHTHSLPAQIPHQAVDQALSVLAHMSLTEAERARYENIEKWYFDEEAILHRVRKEGKEEGRKEGKQAAMIAMARKLLAMQMDTAMIVQLTELPRAAIQKLQRAVDE